MASPREAKNSSETSSKVKVFVGFERSLLLKVRIRADLFNLPFPLFFFPFFSVWSLPWQLIGKCYLAQGWEFGIINSCFPCLWKQGGDWPVQGNQCNREHLQPRQRQQRNVPELEIVAFFFFPFFSPLSQLLENLNGIWAITACDSAPSSRQAIAGSYTHHDTSPVSKVVCKVTVAAEYEKRGTVCISEIRANQGATCAPWKCGWGDFSAVLVNVCVSVYSDRQTSAWKKKILLQRNTVEDNYRCMSVCVPACIHSCVYARRWRVAGLQKSPTSLALGHHVCGFAQHRNGDVRAESLFWKMRYKGCSLHQNNLTGCDGFPLIFQVASPILITSDFCVVEMG